MGKSYKNFYDDSQKEIKELKVRIFQLETQLVCAHNTSDLYKDLCEKLLLLLATLQKIKTGDNIQDKQQ